MDIPALAVDEEFINRLAKVILDLCKVDPPIKTPSIRECGFCNIKSNDCSARIENDPTETSLYLTDDF